LTYVDQQANVSVAQSLQEGLGVEAINADRRHFDHQKSPHLPGTRYGAL
jgi:hypothetical protein